MIDQKGKEQKFDGSSSEVPTPCGRLDNSRVSNNLCLEPSSVGMLADIKLTKGEYTRWQGRRIVCHQVPNMLRKADT